MIIIYIIYNWCNGRVLTTKELTIEHVKKVGKVLANIHFIEVKDNINIEKYKRNNYQKYYDLYKDTNYEWIKYFIDNYNKFINIYDIVYNSYLIIRTSIICT